MKNKNAFTLIELLIVVAIIAVLAAIAVPNFLEARTRSKVSRVQADMRTAGIALEAYCVDAGVYPPCYVGRQALDWSLRLLPLTTPVTYITNYHVLKDVFNFDEFDQDNLLYNPEKIFPYLNRKPFANFDVPEFSDGSWLVLWDEDPESLYFRRQWALFSYGPDSDFDVHRNARTLANVYDASNGTVSSGDLYRAGP